MYVPDTDFLLMSISRLNKSSFHFINITPRHVILNDSEESWVFIGRIINKMP